MSAARSRFLIEGLRGKKQGIEMAVDNFVRAVGCRDGFDYLLHEAPLGLKTLMGTRPLGFLIAGSEISYLDRDFGLKGCFFTLDWTDYP